MIPQRDDFSSFPTPGFSPRGFSPWKQTFSPRASGNFPLFPLLRLRFPGFHGAEDEDDEDRRSLRLLRWCYPSLRAGATFGQCGFGQADRWASHNACPNDVRDVVHIVWLSQIGHPQVYYVTMLVYEKYFVTIFI